VRKGADASRVYAEALRKIEEYGARLAKKMTLRTHDMCTARVGALEKFDSTMTKQAFEARVKKAKQYIVDGDIIQVVLSQRFSAPFKGDAFTLYRALRFVNPSPYMYYLKLGDMTITGSSPEVMVRCEEKNLALRPIAGTRPRGKDDEEDKKLERELLRDPKEKAEHLMLVDLGRNDLGRVSEANSVRVSEFMTVERYSHVMHIVSNVKSYLAKGKDLFDVIRACFPAGTVAGAPKVRAMEIIDELEATKRGPYAGLIGYISFSGNFDSCITIRTVLVKDGKAYLQAGAGIVADSVPSREYSETVNKSKALRQALALAKKARA